MPQHVNFDHALYEYMGVKRCSRCKVIKHFEDFDKKKTHGVGGREASCMPCRREESYAWKQRNLQRVRDYAIAFYHADRDAGLARAERYRAENKAEIARRQKARDVANPEKCRARHKKRAIRVRNDPGLLLRKRVSHSMRLALCGGKGGRNVETLTGWKISELREHIERQFTKGMSWDNAREWHIDHIVPVSSFDLTDEGELRRAYALSNLRPLWAKENREKWAKRLFLI